jgi:lipopolysaccharide biosynthesis regulator YciM
MARRALLYLIAGASAALAGSAREELLALRAKLAEKRQLGHSAGWAAELKFAADHGKDAQLAAEVLFDAAMGQRRSAEILEKLLKTYPKVQPWATLATFELAQSYVERSSTRDKAIALFEAFLQAEETDRPRRAEARLALGRLYRAAAKPQQALEHYRAFLEAFPDRTFRCAEALAEIGALLIENKQPKEAYETYVKLSADYPWELDRRRDLLLAVIQAYRTTQDPEGATAAYHKLLEDLPRSDARRAQVYTGLAMVHLQQKEPDAAAKVYHQMATDPALSSYHQASAYRQLFQLNRQAGDNAATIQLAYEFVTAHPARLLESGNILGELVDALVAERRVDEAVAMARAHYQLAAMSPASNQEAILGVVRALKAKEGSLRSANAFIAYVERGPDGPDGKLGTADDLPDPLAAFRLPPEPKRDRLFAEAARRFANDPLRLAYLYLCWDKPADALRAFRQHYLETLEATSLQEAVTLLARAMRALGCPETEVDAFFAYQNFGPNGPDGKPKTPDDLKDPLLGKK